MKKTLLSFFLLTLQLFYAQNPIQPQVNNNKCAENSDYATFDMDEIAYEIAGTFSVPVTNHLTMSDAEMGVNAITGIYTNTTNPQTIYARHLNLTTNIYQIITYDLTVSPYPEANPFTVSECVENGQFYASFNLDEVRELIWEQNQSSAATEQIDFYESLDELENNYNELWNVFEAYDNEIPIYFKVTNLETGCYSNSIVTLISDYCPNPNCAGATNIEVSNISTNSAQFNWTENGNATLWDIEVLIQYSESLYFQTTSNSILLTDLPCNQNFDFYVRAHCDSGEMSSWNFISFNTNECLPIGQMITLNGCIDNGTTCFDLTQNTSIALANLSETEYSVFYFDDYYDSVSNVNPILTPNNYCMTNTNQFIYARIQNNSNPYSYSTSSFSIVSNTIIDQTSTFLSELITCDDNMDTQVVFDLTESTQDLINTSQITYFNELNDAFENINPISNPNAFTIGLDPFIVTIYARVNYENLTCATIYKVKLIINSVCNNAYYCSQANSLCGSLNTPFINTFQGVAAESGNNYGCLASVPNPTWFYLTVSAPGDLQFEIQQSSDFSFATPDLDVDFICYGPYTSPSEACGQATSIVDCSYANDAVETVNIPNAQIGEFYLIMVTNYSSQLGYIKISQQFGENQGSLDCSGLEFNAFLDSNENGTKDENEVNFPLGTFTYQKNNDGNNFNVTAPSGGYYIFDTESSNSYDVSFSVLPEYASNYNLSTSIYENLNVIIGGGLQTFDFPVTVIQPYTDIAAYIVPDEQPRPGFSYSNKIVYTNLGNQPISNGTLTFTMDENVTISNISQTGTVPTTSGFTFNYNNLLPFQTRTIDVTMQVPTIPTVELGQLLTNVIDISPVAGDVVPLNNANTNAQIIIGSYDPNDKMESRGGEILHSSFGANDYLFYTIRFENTGTASAIKVRIEDLLDEKLDENSLRMIHASHDYVLERNDNQLIWYFEDIQLPPTIEDPILSQGYVYFKIKPKSGFEIGDIIPNTAEIYFDFNPPIITNTFETEFVTLLDIETFDQTNVAVYPNPASNQLNVSLSNTTEIIANIRIIDVSGKKILSLQNINDATRIIDVSSILNGIYFIEIETKNNKITKQKLIIKK